MLKAGGTDTKWFTNLSFIKLKNYYRILEDIWNYRAELTQTQKLDIVPQNNLFTHSIAYIFNLPYEKKGIYKILFR